MIKPANQKMTHHQLVVTIHNSHHLLPLVLFQSQKNLGDTLFIGLAIASAMTITIPSEMIPNTIGKYPFFSYLVAAISWYSSLYL